MSDNKKLTVSPEIIDWLYKNRKLDEEAEKIVQEWQNGKPLNVDDAVTVSIHTGVPFGYFFLKTAPGQDAKKQKSDKLTYRGFSTHIHYDADEEVLYGKIIGIRKEIVFKSKNAADIKKEFEKAVDRYLYERTKDEERER